jgi:hypothetical protein
MEEAFEAMKKDERTRLAKKAYITGELCDVEPS